MKHRQAVGWAVVAILVGIGSLVYLVTNVPPRTATGQLDGPIVSLFFLALFVALTGFGSFFALSLHRRWPNLAGVRRGEASPAVAFRQGAIFAVTIGVIALLAMLQMLDLAFLLVTIIVAALVEAFLQSRR